MMRSVKCFVMPIMLFGLLFLSAGMMNNPDVIPLTEGKQIIGATEKAAAVEPGIQIAADWLVRNQCFDNGWSLLIDGCPDSSHELTGSTGIGLLRAYLVTGDAYHLDAAMAAGNWDVTDFRFTTGEACFAPETPYFLWLLGQVTKDPSYAEHVAMAFFEELDAGTYGADDLDTAGLIERLRTDHIGQSLNTLPLAYARQPVTAGQLGSQEQQEMFTDALLGSLSQLDSMVNPENGVPNTPSDILGLAGAVQGLALNNTLGFDTLVCPDSTALDGVVSLAELADLLADLQNANGSWYSHSALDMPEKVDQDTLTTAMAIIALAEADAVLATDFAPVVERGRSWLLTMQLESGGFSQYPNGPESMTVNVKGMEALAPGRGSASLALTPDAVCYEDTGTITVDIDMSGADVTVWGGQFFLSYDNSVLDFVSADPGDSPFTLQIYEVVNEGAGTIDYAVGIPHGGSGTSSATTMVVLTFTAIDETCDTADLVTFRSSTPPTQLTDGTATPVSVTTTDMTAVTIDSTDPSATAPTNTTVECEGDVPAGVTTYAAYTAAGGTASDNCSAGADLTIGSADGPLTGGACGGTITRTYTITDECGNSTTAAQTITVNDSTDPTASAPTNITVECEGSVPAGVTTYAAYTTAGGTASDNCSAGADLTIGSADGPLTGGACGGTITRTYTITDECGNSTTAAQTITVNDSTDPTAGAPTNITVECEGDVPAGVTTYAAYTSAGGTASDNCSAGADLTIGSADGPLTGGGCGGTITRTYTITDECGNSTTAAQTITVNDTTDPTAGAPTNITVECEGDVPAGITTYAAYTTAGGTASDNCSAGADLTIGSADGPLTGGACGGTITRTYTITDECGNSTTAVQTITVNDTTDPTAGAPTNITVECEGDVPAGVTTYAAYTTAGGTASDNCTAGADLTIGSADGPLTGGACGGTITRTYTITDECGNSTTAVQTITVNDTTDPTAGAPTNVTVECEGDVPAGVTTYAAYTTAGGTASDNCTAGADLTIGSADGPLTGGACGGTITRTYTITDECGNSTTAVQTITVNDSTDPTAGAPTNITVECEGDVPAGVTTYAAYTTAGGTASDNCTAGADLTIGSADGPLTGGACGGTITRTYTIADECGNDVDVVQTITVDDTTDPTATPPTNATVQCAGNVPAGVTTYAAYLAAGGTASDNCTAQASLAISSVDGALTGGPCGGTITRTYTIADACGNSVTADQVFTVNDTIDPVISDCPGNIVVNAEAGGCTADVTWTAPTAADNCNVASFVSSHSPGATFSGTTTVTYTATDDCGNTNVCSFDVTVNAVNEMVVSLDLEGGVEAGPFTRCITFQLWECGGPSSQIVNEVVTFTSGSASATVLVPCGNYTCVAVQDELHSLRRTLDDPDFTIVGTQYVADFATVIDDLVLGNYNNDPWIDILDYGVFAVNWLTDYGSGDTDCSTTAFHADLTGDGVVDTDEFSYIQINFLKSSELICCGTPMPIPPAVTSISIGELVKRGLGELALADLNGDGMLDQADLTAFASGQRPGVKAATTTK